MKHFWFPPPDNRYQALHHAKSLRNTVILEVKFNFHQFQLVCNPYLHCKTVILLQSSVACIQTNTTNQQFGTINGVHAWVVLQLVFAVTLTSHSGMRLQAVTQQSKKAIIDQRIAARQTCCYRVMEWWHNTCDHFVALSLHEGAFSFHL